MHAVANEWLIATQWYQDYCKSWRTSSVPCTGQRIPFADLLTGTPRQIDTSGKWDFEFCHRSGREKGPSVGYFFL